MIDRVFPTFAAADPPGTDLVEGPPAAHWINRFAHFTDAVADVRTDETTAPVDVAAAPDRPAAPALPRRHPFGTELRAQPFPEPHWVATSADCAELLGLPADWAERPDWHALDVFTGRATWPGMRTMATVYSGHQFG